MSEVHEFIEYIVIIVILDKAYFVIIVILGKLPTNIIFIFHLIFF